MHNLKVENYVLFGRQPEDLNLGYSFLDSSERCSEVVREGPGYIRVFSTKTRLSEHQEISVN